MKKWIRFFEIPARDYKRAVQFYSAIFAITLEDCEMEGTRMAFFPADEGGCSGAVIVCEGFDPSPNGVIVSFVAPDSIGATLQRVEQAGGRIIMPECEVGCQGKGRFALFADSEGNRIGLHSQS